MTVHELRRKAISTEFIVRDRADGQHLLGRNPSWVKLVDAEAAIVDAEAAIAALRTALDEVLKLRTNAEARARVSELEYLLQAERDRC